MMILKYHVQKLMHVAIVVHRKVRGGIRAEETMTWMANFFSCIMTWKNKGLDHIAEIAKYA